jgi:hypothetical protein
MFKQDVLGRSKNFVESHGMISIAYGGFAPRSETDWRLQIWRETDSRLVTEKQSPLSAPARLVFPFLFLLVQHIQFTNSNRKFAQIVTTQKSIKHVLRERWYAWEDARELFETHTDTILNHADTGIATSNLMRQKHIKKRKQAKAKKAKTSEK